MKNELITGLLGLFDGILSKPGDSFSAKVTPSGRQVITLEKDGKKASATRYPTTETIVTTTSTKKKK